MLGRHNCFSGLDPNFQEATCWNVPSKSMFFFPPLYLAFRTKVIPDTAVLHQLRRCSHTNTQVSICMLTLVNKKFDILKDFFLVPLKVSFMTDRMLTNCYWRSCPCCHFNANHSRFELNCDIWYCYFNDHCSVWGLCLSSNISEQKKKNSGYHLKLRGPHTSTAHARTHTTCAHLDESSYYLWGVFGQRLHFAVEDEWHQDVFLVGFQHDVAHCHGWSGYCLLTRGNESHKTTAVNSQVQPSESGWNFTPEAAALFQLPVRKNTVLFQSFWGPCRSYHHSSNNIKSALRRKLRSPYRCPSCPAPGRAARAWSTLLASTAAGRETKAQRGWTCCCFSDTCSSN